MKRLFKINRGESQDLIDGSDSQADTPEANVIRSVKLFCESGGQNTSGEEVLHLPVIVEAAESSPAAAREAANRIRKFLSKDNLQRAYVQYNAVMLVRILSDNPGKSFTKNIDVKFVGVVKDLLRDGRDMSVQQILRETLDNLETNKAGDETLVPLIDMWKKEKTKWEKAGVPVIPQRSLSAPVPHPHQQNYFARNHRTRGLPPPHELAQRVEEAKTSSKLLLQLVQSTPPSEMIGNELLKEFAERCQSASRSIQGYIHSDNPAPDEDTLLTLIETNDQLSTAISRHQRALLQARKSVGATGLSHPPPAGSGGLFETPTNQPQELHAATSFNPYNPPPGPPPGLPSKPPPPTSPPDQPLQRANQPYQDPFDDRQENSQHQIDLMPAPLEPQSYGLPPESLSRNTHNPRANPAYSNRQEYDHVNPTPGDDPVSPQEVRRPVVYRF